jgi:predicted HicB family RNase H-like nuclease
MIDVRNLSEEIATLDEMIQSFEGQLNEIRQQREFKAALLRQLQKEGRNYFGIHDSTQQRTDVISE